MLVPAPGPVDLVVIGIQPEHLRCRHIGGRKLLTVHPRFARGLDDVVPGEIVTLSDVAVDATGRSSLMVGTITRVRLDAAEFGSCTEKAGTLPSRRRTSQTLTMPSPSSE
jgi:hypothetical protein